MLWHTGTLGKHSCYLLVYSNNSRQSKTIRKGILNVYYFHETIIVDMALARSSDPRALNMSSATLQDIGQVPGGVWEMSQFVAG